MNNVVNGNAIEAVDLQARQSMVVLLLSRQQMRQHLK